MVDTRCPLHRGEGTTRWGVGKMYADMQAKEAASGGATGGSAGPNGPGSDAKPADDNVVDAEVKEVKKA